jgi:hypothetical protein
MRVQASEEALSEEETEDGLAEATGRHAVLLANGLEAVSSPLSLGGVSIAKQLQEREAAWAALLQHPSIKWEWRFRLAVRSHGE